MKTLLLVFVVLLFLLTLLSSFGGSIRTNEPFYDANPALKEEEEPYTNTMPHESMMNSPHPPESFYQNAGANQSMERFYSNLQDPMKSDSHESFYSDVPMNVSMDGTPSMPMPTTGSTPSTTMPTATNIPSNMPLPTMGNVPQPPALPPMTVTGATNDAVADQQEREQYVNYKKVDVPEPFFNDDKFAGAPL